MHEHRFFGRSRRMKDVELEEKPIELRLGQGISSLRFDGVLRGNHEEGLWKPAGDAVRGDAVLLHRLEKSRLRLGRRSVDLVGQEQLSEDRTGEKLEVVLALVEDIAAGDV